MFFCFRHTDSCKDFKEAFERVFSAPGEAAVLNCTLDIHHLFNPANTSYNITWYDKRTGCEVKRPEHDVILRDESLWFINITMEHQGSYICVIRYGHESLINFILSVRNSSWPWKEFFYLLLKLNGVTCV